MAIDFALIDPITDIVIGAAIKVHRALGPGLLESAYHKCLLYELHRANLDVVSKQKLPVLYESVRIDCGYELDLMINGLVIGEVKSVSALAPIHSAQALTYAKLTGCPVALLLNFNVPVMKHGIRRLLNKHATRGLKPDPPEEPQSVDREKKP